MPRTISMRCSSLMFAAAATSSALGPAASGNAAAGDPRQRRTHEVGPRRAGRGLASMARQMLGGAFAVAVLLGGKAKKKRALALVRIERHGAIERRLGLGGDDAVRRRDQRLAEIGLARRRSRR